jgi:RimJ/RimL family protein N-acetyltransferase
MDLREFAAFHLPAFAGDEIRFNIQIAIITAAVAESAPNFLHWTLGAPGECATKSAGYSILLGRLGRDQCQDLAQAVAGLDYPGVVGADDRAHWFAERAAALGVKFHDAIPQRLHVLSEKPRYPGANGFPREATSADATLLFEWMSAFHREAVPHDPPPEQSRIEKLAASGRCYLWIADGHPVSMAAISRRLPSTAAIAPVYTPPEHRARGYAGSITAAVVDRAFAEGKRTVCLYTNLRNPGANRCYAKIGFRRYCDSWHYLRDSITGC